MPYKLIKLTRGVVAAVDTKDFERVNKYLWTPYVRAGKTERVTSHDGGKVTLLHRFILGLKHGDKRDVDHWNRNVFDNRRCNLRICSRSENLRNSKKQSGTVSQYKGVSLVTGSGRHPFRAQIRINGRYKHLGCFATEIEAAKAYDKAARKEFERFALLNFSRKSELPPTPPPEVVGQKPQPAASRYTARRNRKASRFVGVDIQGKKWRWQIRYKGIYYQKAGFSTELQAAQAREAFIIKNKWPHQRNFS